MGNRDLVGMCSIVLPVSIAPREGKYYGTEITDANGDLVLTLWTASGEPSEREKSRWGDWTPELWDDYCCDSHWECDMDFKTAMWLVHVLNAAQIPAHEMFHEMKVCNLPSFSTDDIHADNYRNAATGYGPSTQKG